MLSARRQGREPTRLGVRGAATTRSTRGVRSSTIIDGGPGKQTRCAADPSITSLRRQRDADRRPAAAMPSWPRREGKNDFWTAADQGRTCSTGDAGTNPRRARCGRHPGGTGGDTVADYDTPGRSEPVDLDGRRGRNGAPGEANGRAQFENISAAKGGAGPRDRQTSAELHSGWRRRRTDPRRDANDYNLRATRATTSCLRRRGPGTRSTAASATTRSRAARDGNI